MEGLLVALAMLAPGPGAPLPRLPARDDPLVSFARTLAAGDPVLHDGAAFVPFYAPEAAQPAAAWHGAAVAARETADGAQRRVRLVNEGALPVLVPFGALVRTEFTEDAVLAPALLPRGKSAFPPVARVRPRGTRLLPPAASGLGLRGRESLLDATSAPDASAARRARELDEAFAEALDAGEGVCVGGVFLASGRVVSAHLFPSPRLLREAWPDLLVAHAEAPRQDGERSREKRAVLRRTALEFLSAGVAAAGAWRDGHGAARESRILVAELQAAGAAVADSGDRLVWAGIVVLGPLWDGVAVEPRLPPSTSTEKGGRGWIDPLDPESPPRRRFR